MRLNASPDSRYKTGFVNCMNACLSTSIHKGFLPLCTGISGFDDLTGGLPVGDVTVLVGHAGAGKSSILRNMFIGAINHTLFLPLQDGSSVLATQRVLAIAAGVDSCAFCRPLRSRDKVLMFDAIEELQAKPISMHVIDNMTTNLLYNIAEEEFGEKEDCPGVLDGQGIVLVDNLDMIDGFRSRRRAIQELKNCVFGSEVALLVVDDRKPDEDGTDELANAGLVVSAEVTAEPYVTELMVLKDSNSELGRTALIEFDPKTMAIKTAEQANSR